MAASSISGPQAGPPMSVSDIYANARGLGAHLREKSAESDEARQLPADVVAPVREAGMFRLAMPKDWGGPRAQHDGAGRGDRRSLEG
jgi:indole-3-acetate monooxygenase